MGRHKEFEPEEVLEKAMALFWRQGFERTSMQELVEAMGIHKRSIYDTFGDKHMLFLMALERYADIADRDLRQASVRDTNARLMIKDLLESSIVIAADNSLGCLLVNSATEVSGYDSQAATRINDNFDRSAKLITQIVARGQAKAEISDKYEAAGLGSIIFNTWVGIRVQARSGISVAKLQKMVDSVIALLD